MSEKKISRKKKSKRPLGWLEDATPDEIGEALLAVDEVKAYQVAAYLGTRLPPELARLVEGAHDNMSRDPLHTMGSALMSGLRGAFHGPDRG